MNRILRISGLTVLLTTVLGTTIFVLKPRIPIGGMIQTLVAVVNLFSSQDVRFEGRYYMTPGGWTHLYGKDGEVRITGPDGARIHATFSNIQTVLHLPSLFKKRIALDSSIITSLHVSLFPAINDTALPPRSSPTEDQPEFVFSPFGTFSGSDIFFTLYDEHAHLNHQLQLDIVSGSLSKQREGSLHLKGILDSHPFESQTMLSSSATTEHSAPLSLQTNLQFREANISAQGAISITRDNFTALDIDYHFSGQHFSDLSLLLGYNPQTDTPFSCKGHLTHSEEETSLIINEISPGTDDLHARISMEYEPSLADTIRVEVSGKRINADEILRTFAPRTKESHDIPTTEPNKPGTSIAALQEFFSGKTVEMRLGVENLEYGKRRASEIQVQTTMINGVVDKAPFCATFDHSSMQGHYSFDIASTPPRVSTHITAHSWNLGESLNELQLTEDAELFADAIDAEISTSGFTKNELLENLEVSLQLHDGTIVLPDPNTDNTLPVKITESLVTGKPGEGFHFEMLGHLKGLPVEVTARLGNVPKQSPEGKEEVPIHMMVRGEHTKLEVDGVLPFPFRLVGIEARSRFSGTHPDILQNFLNVNIPIPTPYSFDGTLLISDSGYHLNNVNIAISDSLYTGTISLETNRKRPTWNLELVGKHIQLANLKIFDSNAPSLVDSESDSDIGRKQPQPFSLSTFLESFHAAASIKAEEVYSGDEYVGRGSVEIVLKEGKLTVGPLFLVLPESSVEAAMIAELAGDDILYSLDLDVRQLNYGIISRWLKPDSDQSGILHLRTALHARVPPQQDIMASTNGYIDLCIQPENFHSGIIDLWAVNLLNYLIPLFSSSTTSQFNCIAARLNVDNGIMTEEDLLADTSRIQVKGTLNVDFHKRWIESRLRPVPKRPQFYSLATPVTVSGKLDDLKVGVARGGVVGTMIRFVTSYVAVPVQWIILENTPPDGSAECMNLFYARSDSSRQKYTSPQGVSH